MTAWFDPRGAIAAPIQGCLPLTFPADGPSPQVSRNRQSRGRTAYLSGLAAEDSVARDYTSRGLTVLARRWRGSCAEIDLILADGDAVIFVEVKKSRSFDAAILSLGPAQRRRIMSAASEFLGERAAGQLTPARLDLAMVNDQGAINILENAFGEGD
ncbi:MAG: YraN family protein [Paracoccaceae bacterium]|nr:YraN family protein [Paracoccaceae bacterium]